MSHKTYDQPPTVYVLFMQHSKARVLCTEPDGLHMRSLTNNEVRHAHARKYAHNR